MSLLLYIYFISYLVYQFDILPVKFIIAKFGCYNFNRSVFDKEFMSFPQRSLLFAYYLH